VRQDGCREEAAIFFLLFEGNGFNLDGAGQVGAVRGKAGGE
jgi:hypothetical protein